MDWLSGEVLADLRQQAEINPDALADPKRCEQFMLRFEDLAMDFSRQTITIEGLKKLIALADEAGIVEKRNAMLKGEVVNVSENRAATHTRLRTAGDSLGDANIKSMTKASEQLLALGIEDVVSIGIGGSALGPELVVSALPSYHQGAKIHFIGNMDPSHLLDCLSGLDPSTTGFVVISKTFTTEETLANFALAKSWLEASKIESQKRVLAVTANPNEAKKHGFSSEQIVEMDEGVGGRFSLWSGVGIGAMLAIGKEQFCELLKGAEAMDKHFATASAEKNLPLMAGLLRFWNASILERGTQAIIPYEQRLSRLPAWLRQLEMESNGKTHNEEGKPIRLPSAPVIFGEVGTLAQHSFFQLLHQSAQIVPVDFLAAKEPTTLDGKYKKAAETQHQALLVNMVAQADALAFGKGDADFPGGRPSTIITWDETSPYALGRLLAYYEHATLVMGWMLGLNSFDQPGVELGKTLARNYQAWLKDDQAKIARLPSASQKFLKNLK